MKLVTKNNEDLNVYYDRQKRNQIFEGDCNESTKTHWWGFTPYDLQETLYYVYKMLVLPGLIAGIVIILIIIGVYENLIIGIISTILVYIASLLLTIYRRERSREQNFAIPDNDLLISGDILNELEDNNIVKIGFVGDIMMMKKYKLTFSNDVIRFFNNVDIIIGNLEGIVTDLKCLLAKQAHTDSVLKILQGLLGNNTKWLLCLSNNHSIDFGNQEFHKSLHTIRSEPKIDVFGRNDVPNVFFKDKDINIYTASKWSNQKNWDCISRYRDTDLNLYHYQNKFNVLYPHWGYENERYVRPSIQNIAKTFLKGNDEKKLDLIFGHHPHTRQPIMKVKDENNSLWKFVAFSGGNFTSGVKYLRRKKHIHGIILKCEIGFSKQNNNQLAIGKVEWKGTINKEDKTKPEPTKIVEYGEEEGINRLYMLIISIVAIVIFAVLKILDFFL